MRVRTAEDLHVEHPRQGDVVEVLALAADEARVLLALDGVADTTDLVSSRHLLLPPSWSWPRSARR